MNMADSLGDLRQAVPDVALPRLDNNPARRLESGRFRASRSRLSSNLRAQKAELDLGRFG